MKDNKLKEDIINALDDNLSIMDEYITGTGAATDKLYTLFTDVVEKFSDWKDKDAWQVDFGNQQTFSNSSLFQHFITNIYQQ